jgi:hypothetical protein
MSQLELFAPPASPAQPVRRGGGMPRSVEAKWARAWTVEVRQAFLDEAMKRPGEWIESSHFYRTVAVPHDIGCCWGHAMGSMVRAHMLEERPRHYGSKSPAEGGYLGYCHLYRWHPPMPAVARANSAHERLVEAA